MGRGSSTNTGSSNSGSSLISMSIGTDEPPCLALVYLLARSTSFGTPAHFGSSFKTCQARIMENDLFVSSLYFFNAASKIFCSFQPLGGFDLIRL